MAHDQELDDHDRGLSHDLPTLLSRRRALALFNGAGLAAALAGCGNTSTGDNSGGSPSPSSTTGTAAAGTEIPEETAGPYPATAPTGSTSSPRAASYAATSPRASDRRPESPRACR